VSDNAKAIVAQALKGDKEVASLVSMIDARWIENQHDAAIIATIIDLAVSGKPITSKTIAGRIAGVIGPDECRSLFTGQNAVVEYTQSCTNEDGSKIKAHAEQIKLDYVKRLVKENAKRVVDELPRFSSAEQAASGAIEIMASGIDQAIGDDGAEHSASLVQSWLHSKQNADVGWAFEWPLPTWARRGKMRQSEIAIFAAPTGVGKSWFGIQMLQNACRSGARVALFSGEMTPEEQLDRIVQMGGYSEADIEQGNLNPNVMARLQEVMDWDFTVYDGRITIDRIRAAVIRARAVGKPYNMVIIDHVHLMDFGASSNYRLALNNGMSILKSEIANREKCAIVLLAQLRRPSDSESRRRPRKEDIKESSAIEQIGDYVFLMCRQNEDDVDSTVSTIWCDKRRKGRRFPAIDVEIHPRLNRIIELEGLMPTVIT
jgi:replicative DNA helicase